MATRVRVVVFSKRFSVGACWLRLSGGWGGALLGAAGGAFVLG